MELEDKEVSEGWVLAGKFLSKRRINLEAVVKTLKPIWKTTENFMVQDTGDNTTTLPVPKRRGFELGTMG